MITEDYVSFETAKLLKEKGFDESCFGFYTPEKELHFTLLGETNSTWLDDSISAPTLQMAMKWLREVHHLTVDVFHFRDWKGDWKVNIKTIPDDYFKADYSYPELKPAETYEKICEAAIKYCLENLL